MHNSPSFPHSNSFPSSTLITLASVLGDTGPTVPDPSRRSSSGTRVAMGESYFLSKALKLRNKMHIN